MNHRSLPILIVLLALVLATSACAMRRVQPPIVDPDGDVEATPEPVDPKVGSGDRMSDEEMLARLQAEQRRKPEITERDITPDTPPAVDVPPPSPPEPLEEQGPLAGADRGRREEALAGSGASSRNKAALAMTREGVALLEDGNDYLAEKRFESALSIDPQCGQAYLGLAELRFEQKKWDQSADLATKAALRLRGNAYFRARAHMVAAKSMINLDRPRAAYKQVESALEADPGNNEAKVLRFRLSRHLGIAPSADN
jgi:tetratricopeptide (TPR) repeat protein